MGDHLVTLITVLAEITFPTYRMGDQADILDPVEMEKRPHQRERERVTHQLEHEKWERERESWERERQEMERKRQRDREWEEYKTHQQQRERWERERQGWDRDGEQEKCRREEEERKREERRREEEKQKRIKDRKRLGLYWDEPQARQCVSYRTQEYTACLRNIPFSFNWREACEETPIEIQC